MTVTPGDPFGPIKTPVGDSTPSAQAVNKFHSKADTDSGADAVHHTLGIKHNQASPGDHLHDGKSSRRLMEGQNVILTGSKGGNVALANLITLLANTLGFTDSTT